MDVGAWLKSLGLEQYEAAFHENGVNPEILRHLTADDLKECRWAWCVARMVW